MLTAITTRKSTPLEDAEPWPGGSARPVLAYLTTTVGLTSGDAADLLTAARTAQAEGGPGTLADYPIPGGHEHLLIHYAPGSRAYRLKLTSPQDQAPPGHDAGPDRAPGPAPDEPSRGPATPHSGPAGDDSGTPAPGPAGRAGPAADPATATVTITLWHNIATGAHDRPTGLLDGYQPGHPMVRVFAYQTSPAGRSPGGARRRGVRGRQRPRRRRHRPGAVPPLLRPRAAVPVGRGCRHHRRSPPRRRPHRLDPGPRRPEPGPRSPARHPPPAGAPLTPSAASRSTCPAKTGDHPGQHSPAPRELPAVNAVTRASWEPARGGLNNARVHERSTRPVPAMPAIPPGNSFPKEPHHDCV